ncbi:hypothetical protein Taro_055039 [Colocasia esculenta]|uniref:Calcineurin-like phosphoesterase domain-containing protein n=1 Tax=Colocasia esculenta TaxID=4460 RepID=A0A843XSE1_COLES|nr:hypothetical protein [Colocasia esculenta]
MEASPGVCGAVPPLLSSFVDALVDFSVSGLFLPTQDDPRLDPNTSPASRPPLPTRFPAPARLVAIGDLHGDLPKAAQAFALAGLADPATGRWTGGTSVAVQVGDVLDRGGDEIRLLYLLHRLKIEAAHAGGQLLTILGNHDVMNVAFDFRYVTREGLAEFERWGSWYREGIAMKRLCDGVEDPGDPFEGIPRVFQGVKEECFEGFRARIAALRPNGPISRKFLAGNQTVVVVGDSVFVHGGLLRDHVEYGLERLNEEVRAWIEGSEGSWMPRLLRGRDSLVWLRKFSDGENCDCAHLEEVLSSIPGVRRMVMGHTIQERINGVCENRAIRVDVGLSKGCTNGLPEVLEIVDGKHLRILTSNEVFRQKQEYKTPAVVREGGGRKARISWSIPRISNMMKQTTLSFTAVFAQGINGHCGGDPLLGYGLNEPPLKANDTKGPDTISFNDDRRDASVEVPRRGVVHSRHLLGFFIVNAFDRGARATSSHLTVIGRRRAARGRRPWGATQGPVQQSVRLRGVRCFKR